MKTVENVALNLIPDKKIEYSISKLSVKEMSLEEAVDKFQLEKSPFMLFVNKDTKQLNVVYKEQDNIKVCVIQCS